ncbi:hypothetical protein DMB92_00060 [Campylobacter sp. MIT 99-7217]|uniref:hypothetical protein n=1 Tax=Campylobacter sp. MIT 99-7217 TaxID=535091 RepID=UPI001158F081|nr:hypothetical protein [Campylobacter sp. MIT 99-7217]TQR34399.1 hypothetical protein DMB92_00060 [Campylobacter sp. MIT 99-7217]
MKKIILLTLLSTFLISLLEARRPYRPTNPSLSVDRSYRPGYADQNNYYNRFEYCKRMYGHNRLKYLACLGY